MCRRSSASDLRSDQARGHAGLPEENLARSSVLGLRWPTSGQIGRIRCCYRKVRCLARPSQSLPKCPCTGERRRPFANPSSPLLPTRSPHTIGMCTRTHARIHTHVCTHTLEQPRSGAAASRLWLLVGEFAECRFLSGCVIHPCPVPLSSIRCSNTDGPRSDPVSEQGNAAAEQFETAHD